MSRHVFTYGSLMFPEVWTLVVTGRYRSIAGTLAGHGRFAVAGQTYPGMIAAADERVVGVLHLDVDDADLARLDDFEGDDYRRVTVSVDCADGTTRASETYLYLRQDRLLPSAWDPEAFAMDRFIATYCRDKLGP
jgi:gamma-glutamylcyclotransferase (GGCT)/AIG2-like uncharacterized protein YtfP